MRTRNRAKVTDNNRLNILPDDDSGDEGTVVSNRNKPPKKPPPIIISGAKIAEIKTSLNTLLVGKKNSEHAEFKLSGNNIHVYAKNVSDHKEIIKHCKTNTLQFNTHQLYDERRVKICLYGLTEISTDEIKNELINKHQITPADIKMLKTNPKIQSKSRIYLLYFRKGDGMKINKLREIIGLFHMRVRWDYYTPRRQGPTQCSRCQLFGHGAENCYRDFKCVSCGGNHDSKNCDKRRKPTPNEDTQPGHDVKPKVPDEQVSCANCGGNHTASYRGCEVRKEYLVKLQRSLSYQKQQTQKQYIYNDRDFPPAPPPARNYWFERAQTQPVAPSNNPNNDSTTLIEIMKMQLQFQQQMFNTMTQMVNQITTKMEEMMQVVMSVITSKNDNQILSHPSATKHDG